MLQGLAKFIMLLGGWTRVGTLPDAPRAVVVAAPHTSNWDGFWALVYKVAVGLDVRFFAKQSLFWFPLSWLLTSLGAIPLNRNQARSAVKTAVELFDSKETFYFALAPEGTRGLTAGWKSGFYRIAEQADVPVFLGALDYEKREIGIAGRLDPSGDVAADMQICAEIYKPFRARWPEKSSPVRIP